MKVTQRLAAFIAETSLEKMPPEVIVLTKRAIIDTVGVALAGSVNPSARALAGHANRFGCKPAASIIGSSIMTSSTLAAMVNGFSAHVLDYDDTHDTTQGHSSAVLVPVVFSLGEEMGSTGKQVIEAYVLGIETWARVSRIMPQFHIKGWHPSGTLGTVGAAVAAAKLLKLTQEQIVMALGIACSEAAGLIKNFGTTTKPLHVGNAAKNGIIAALLAKEGFTASGDILEGDTGFPATFYGKGTLDALSIVANLGAPFALTHPGLNVKNYPSCYDTHKALDAILHLITLHDIKPEDVESIECHSNPVTMMNLRDTAPATAMEARFSMQFAISVALTDRKFGLEQVTDGKVNDPIVRALMKRVTLSIHPDWIEGRDTAHNRADVITVRLKNGRVYRDEVLASRGSSKNPLTEEALLEKYRECAGLVFKKEHLERFINLLGELEKLKDIKNLVQTATGSDL